MIWCCTEQPVHLRCLFALGPALTVFPQSLTARSLARPTLIPSLRTNSFSTILHHSCSETSPPHYGQSRQLIAPMAKCRPKMSSRGCFLRLKPVWADESRVKRLDIACVPSLDTTTLVLQLEQVEMGHLITVATYVYTSNLNTYNHPELYSP